MQFVVGEGFFKNPTRSGLNHIKSLRMDLNIPREYVMYCASKVAPAKVPY